MTTDPKTVASALYETLEKAWNDGDGPSYGAPFAADALFVEVRGLIHDGGPAEIGADHQGIFDTIYKGSTIRYELDTARAVSDDVILARGHATLDAPAGPMVGTHEAISTIVAVHRDDEWRVVAFHNTLITA
jgi:uncharacterized protein (TIGR02246 family)